MCQLENVWAALVCEARPTFLRLQLIFGRALFSARLNLDSPLEVRPWFGTKGLDPPLQERTGFYWCLGCVSNSMRDFGYVKLMALRVLISDFFFCQKFQQAHLLFHSLCCHSEILLSISDCWVPLLSLRKLRWCNCWMISWALCISTVIIPLHRKLMSLLCW